MFWLVPFYRRTGEVSAYEHLEHRFGPWARTYAVVCFLLDPDGAHGRNRVLAGARLRTAYGLGRVVRRFCVTGTVMTVYTLPGWHRGRRVDRRAAKRRAGGRHADLPGRRDRQDAGRRQRDRPRRHCRRESSAWAAFGDSLTRRRLQSTFWVVLLYGLVMNLGNFATDQSYVQRYITARDDREAKKGVWLTALLYVPVAAIFFFIGTACSCFIRSSRELLASGITGRQGFAPCLFPRSCRAVWPAWWSSAIFAASMDSNLNSMATLTYCDIYQRYFRPHARRTRRNLRAARRHARLGCHLHARRHRDDLRRQ